MNNKNKRIPPHELVLNMLDSCSGADGSNPHGIGGDHSSHGLGERNSLLQMLNNMIIPQNKVDNVVKRLRELIKKLRKSNKDIKSKRSIELQDRFNHSVKSLEKSTNEIENYYKKV